MAKKVVTRFKPPKPRHYIKEWRKHRGITQEALAARIEMEASSISQLETGKQGYSEKTLLALADALQCDPGDLLMRNPLDTEAPWSIWERLKPMQRRQAIIILRTLAGEEQDEAAA